MGNTHIFPHPIEVTAMHLKPPLKCVVLRSNCHGGWKWCQMVRHLFIVESLIDLIHGYSELFSVGGATVLLPTRPYVIIIRRNSTPQVSPFYILASMSGSGPSPTSETVGIITHRHTVARDSPTNASMPESQESRTQEDTKDLTMNELTCATFFVDLTAEDAVFSADSNNVQAVLHRLQDHYHLTSNTLLRDDTSSETNPRFPPGGFDKESHSYEPLIHLLNMIVGATNECLPATQRYLRHLRFHRYGLEVKKNYGSKKSLKPDGVGLVVEMPAERKISWGQVEVVIEVKTQIPALIKHAATYARCSLVNNQRRSFAIAIGFDHKRLDARFLVFHRSGLSSSRPLSLRTPQGFENVVKHIVGMLSIRDEAGYGLDVTRSQEIFSINDRYYQVVSLLCMRDSLRGRSTVVYNLEGTILAY